MGATMVAQMALDGASAIANSVAQSKVNHARSAAMADQAARQGLLDQQVAAQNADALGHYSNFGADNAKTQSSLAALYTGHDIGNPGATAPTGVMPAATGIVQQEDAKQAGKAAAFGEQQGGALAAMNAAGNTLQLGDLLRHRNLQQVGLLDQMKKGQAQVLPFALDAANQKGSGWRTFGDILHGAGQIVGSIGSMGAMSNPFAAASAPAAGAGLPTLASGTVNPATAATIGGTTAGVPALMSSGNAFLMF